MEDKDSVDPLFEGWKDLPPEEFEAAEPPAGLKEAVFGRTSALIRARRMRRRGALVIGLLAVYAVGVLTPQPQGDLPPGETARLPEVGSPTPVRAAPAGPADPAELLERVIDAPPAERARLLREAGDAFLAARGDIDSALDCYRQVLELSPASRGRPEVGDTWLLAALKTGQRDKE